MNFKLLGIHFHVDLNKMMDLNFKPKLLKLQNSINHWKRRLLTPLGRITVIKTLLIPTLNHLFIAVPNPNGKVMKQINDMLYEFLWQGPARIKSSVVTKCYLEGGIRMTNLSAMINSLKLSWIRRMVINEGKWLDILKKIYRYRETIFFGNKIR